MVSMVRSDLVLVVQLPIAAHARADPPLLHKVIASCALAQALCSTNRCGVAYLCRWSCVVLRGSQTWIRVHVPCCRSPSLCVAPTPQTIPHPDRGRGIWLVVCSGRLFGHLDYASVRSKPQELASWLVYGKSELLLQQVPSSFAAYSRSLR